MWNLVARRTTDRRTPRAATEAAASSEATRGIVEAGASSSVARRPGATSPVPEVTIKGRSEPASTAPRGEYIFAKIPMRRVRQG